MLPVNGFYGFIKSNNARSLVMFAGFLVAFEMVAAVAFTLPMLMFHSSRAGLLHPIAFFEAYGIHLFFLAVGLFLIQAGRYVDTIGNMVRFNYVSRRTHPRLVNTVETLAIAAGVPIPKVALIDTPARNAFACGISASSAVIVATRGLVEALDDDELSAVIAHEIAHVKNGDIRLMAAANIFMANLQLIEKANLFRLSTRKRTAGLMLMPPVMLLFLFANAVNHCAMTIARVSRLLISSSREFIADAEAVQLTQNPGALVSALCKIHGRSTVIGVDPHAEAMMIDGASEGALATHPTIAERIAALTRLAGPLALLPTRHKDSRPLDQLLADRTRTFGRKGGVPAAAMAMEIPPIVRGKSLIQRVSVQTDENIFGLTPQVRKTMRMGCLGWVGLYVGAIMLLGIVSASFSHRNSSPSAFDPSSSETRSHVEEREDGTFRSIVDPDHSSD